MQILHVYRTFGDAEIQMLKKKVIENRELLIKVKEMQAAHAQNVEQQMLSALKDTVDRMEDIREQAQGDSESADSMLKSLERMEELRMKMEEKQKMTEMLAEIDIGKLLNGGGKQESQKSSDDGKRQQPESETKSA